MCKRHTHLTSQLEAALIEGESLQAEVAALKKENKALVLETQDLSRQVTLLLKEEKDGIYLIHMHLFILNYFHGGFFLAIINCLDSCLNLTLSYS